MPRHYLFTLFVLCLMLLPACATKQAVKKAIAEDPALVMDILRENRGELLSLMQQAVAEQELDMRRDQWLEQLAQPFEPVIEGDRAVRGSVIAPITIVEYSDFFCGYCARGSRTVQALMERHPDQVRLVFKHYAMQPGAADLAALFEAVAEQDVEAAWIFKKQVFLAQGLIKEEGPESASLNNILASLGVDVKQVRKDAASERIAQRIRSDIEEARSFGFRGTPSFVMGGLAIEGAAPLNEFEEALSVVQKHKEGTVDCDTCQK